MADLGEEAYSSQMKVIATFLRLLEELMRNKQQDLRYGTKTQRRGIFRRMKDFVGGVFKKVYDGTFGRLSRNGKDYGQLDLNDPAVAKLFADTMKQMGMDTMHEDNNLLFSTSDIAKIMAFSKMVEQELGKKIEHENDTPEKEQSQEHGQDHEKQADAVKMLDSDEISNRAEAIRSHDGMDPDSRTKQVESWKEDLSAKVGNAFEASRDANGRPNLNNFARQCNLRGIAVQFANDGELLFTDANQHHKQVRADNLDPKFSRNSEAFNGQKMSKPLKQKQEEIIKSTDQRNHERSHAHDSQDHGDAHGSENKAR